MKNNQPITQREVPFPPNTYLVSRTDLKGIIIQANEAFVEISGFTHDELIGKSHNIVRHPDMPEAAFADLWATVKSGLPWRGIVKNRCKNGDHYWVEAFVTPIRKNGEIIGYQSVRTPAPADRRAQAEAAYKAAGQKGSLPRTGRRSLSVKLRLWAGLALLVALMAVTGFIGLNGMANSNAQMTAMYSDNLLPSNLVNRMMFLLSDNRSQVMLGLQHDPANPNAKLHDHALDMHIDATLKNRTEINALLDQLKLIALTDQQKALLDKFGDARERFSKEGVNVARNLLKDGKYTEANATLLLQINPLYREMQKAGEALIEALSTGAKERHQHGEAEYQRIRAISLGLLALAVLAALGGGALLIASIVKPIQQAIHAFERIAEGKLTDEIDIGGRDEAGVLLCNLATMQTTLKAMLDDIAQASRHIDTRCRLLENRMQQVTRQSEDQYHRVEGVAATAEEFSQSVQEVASSAAEAAAAARQTQERVIDSNANIGQSMQATARVVDAVTESNSTIGELKESIVKIGDITHVIAEIANQTNLLALNAAIEAARAGEAGRGFAVVADEVRKLAERTTLSTADITQTVQTIQQVTAQAVSSMDRAAQEVQTGIGKLQESVAGLESITTATREVTDMAGHISDSARQQGVASEDVANSMQQITILIEQNTESAKSARQAADELLATARSLDTLIASFELHRR